MDGSIDVYRDDEESPSEKRRSKAFEVPVFTQEDKENLRRSLEKIDRLSRAEGLEELRSGVESLSRSVERIPKSQRVEGLDELRSSVENLSYSLRELASLPSAVRSNDERIIMLLSKVVENLEATTRALNDVKTEVNRDVSQRIDAVSSGLDERLFSVDANLNYLKGLVADAAVGRDERFSSALQAVSDKIDGHLSLVNSRLDSLQATEPLNDMSLRIEGVRNDLASIDTSIDSARKDIGTLSSDLDYLKKEVSSLKKVKAPRIKIPTPPTTPFEHLAEARKRVISKRVPKKNQAEKKRLMSSIIALDARVLDVFIFSALSKKALGAPGIKELVPVSETKIRKRLNELVKKRRVKKIKRGKATFFGLK